MIEYFHLGESASGVEVDKLYPHTQALLKALHACPYTHVREIRFDALGQGKSEYIVIDAGDGTVDSGNPAGIRRRERLAIGVNPDFRVPILVYTLRKDFPALSHQHPRTSDGPRQLCLYDHAWSAIERGWTPERFIARMFWWFRESAVLKLHRDDQPLEQLFYLSPYQLILPSNYAEYSKPGTHTLTIFKVDEGESVIFKAVPTGTGDSGKPVRTVSVAVDPVESATLVSFPVTLGDLQDQLASWGSGLYEQLDEVVFGAIEDGVSPAQGAGEGIIILVWIPRTRDGQAERFDVMGYMLNHSLFDLAKALDMLGPADSKGRCERIRLIGGHAGDAWKSLALMPVEVRSALTRQNARDMSGIDDEAGEFQGVLAGLGALGSALADLWVRQGWGQWTLVDPDRLLPHNLTRHTGIDALLGIPKVNAVRNLAAASFPNWNPPKAIATSILAKSSEIASALSSAEVLVDVTTTFEAPRDLAKSEEAPRTASLFVTPSGLSSVMILEDRDRRQRVDGLEGQYYRAILDSDWGQKHLANHLGDRWVGGGCRDISVRMSNECIHIHAGILSRQLRQSVALPRARICVWESNEQSGSVSVHEVALSEGRSVESGDWTVKYDVALLEKLQAVRRAALPNETGGAILGVTDLKTKTIVIVDVLPAPPDSEASPTHFIRGKDGQSEAMERVHQLTAKVVDYVGEWHSHPNGCTTKLSPDDEKLLDTLHRQMEVEGLPALMLIVNGQEMSVTVR